ncbi:MAG: hypothetical protein ABIF71_14320 [Planctomycetota bacterium]
MTRRTRFLLLVLIAAGAALGFVALNWKLGRPDRVRAARNRDRMVLVRDQVLRYEAEHARLPASLDELVPAYVRGDELIGDGQPLYVYDPARRLLIQREGARVHGLWSYRMPPAAAALPEVLMPPPRVPSASSAPSVLPPGPAPVISTGPPVSDAWVAGALVVPQGPALPPAPAGAYVFEAEHFTDTNYGWEVMPDAEAAGGAYLHCKEGVANGPGQTVHGVFNFHDVRSGKEVTCLRYHFHLPEAGRFYVYGRFWTTDSHCSNHLCIAIDKGGPAVGGMDNRTPFQWMWSPVEGSPMQLEAGDHYLHVFIHEDGMRVD